MFDGVLYRLGNSQMAGFNPAPQIPHAFGEAFFLRAQEKAEKEGRRSDAAGAAFPRIVPVVETGASALRTFGALLNDGAGRNRAEKPLPLTPNRGRRRSRPSGFVGFTCLDEGAFHGDGADHLVDGDDGHDHGYKRIPPGGKAPDDL